LWIEYPKSFFPVILIVFLLRSFLVEPFKIPSGSMVPTLVVGDFILVNKFAYGIRIPLINKKIINVGEPKRGDVMVFRFPEDPSLDYIKRVSAFPATRSSTRTRNSPSTGSRSPASRFPIISIATDPLLGSVRRDGERVEHAILLEGDAPAAVPFTKSFPFRENCNYNSEGVTCTVPPGHYFMMGDNRDNSADSRVWGSCRTRISSGRLFHLVQFQRATALRNIQVKGIHEEPARHYPDWNGGGVHRHCYRSDPGLEGRSGIHRVLDDQEGDSRHSSGQQQIHRGGGPLCIPIALRDRQHRRDRAGDLEVTKEGNDIVVSVAYPKRIPLFGNVSLVIDFAASSNN